MAAAIERGGGGELALRPDFTVVGPDRLIGSAEWAHPDGSRERRFYVLTIRGDRIADMQACASWRQAKRFARRAR
ncbi:MAG TPA: hypothetical protein VFB26_05600 [Gaiellaceae bacterium]|nr:hypothetical protein [Gaiellaceae bacterium]